ncbi:hypothetical protein COB55_05830 [Candidatus Wolfebacteria bacterium]|nr:MAG: hypothetical protein COB55_05830 [Candidatus Wolfebacteria bacterium]
MIVKPKINYRHSGYPDSQVFSNQEYKATIATNQPDYKLLGQIFISSKNGPELLLNKGEYTIIKG